jgi:hypothetical protein
MRAATCSSHVTCGLHFRKAAIRAAQARGATTIVIGDGRSVAAHIES